jgi:hypothetical protein
MPKDISDLVRFRREIPHKTGLPKRHRDTSSKRPPEAMVEKGMKTRRQRACKSSGRTWGAALQTGDQLDGYIKVGTKIRTILQAREGGETAGGA